MTIRIALMVLGLVVGISSASAQDVYVFGPDGVWVYNEADIRSPRGSIPGFIWTEIEDNLP